MGTAYELRINCDKKHKTSVEAVLGSSANDSPEGWELVIEEDSPNFVNALSIFIELISTNIVKLNQSGIKAEEISFWYLYEYDQQCNMEFSPEITRQIGNLGIMLCISCWEK